MCARQGMRPMPCALRVPHWARHSPWPRDNRPSSSPMPGRTEPEGRTVGHDDLGAATLRRHPRAGQWQQLDVTVANLTFEQTFQMADLAAHDGRREAARSRVLAAMSGEV